MAYVIEAKKTQKNGVYRRYYIDDDKNGESGWVKKRFDAKFYSSPYNAKQAKNMIGKPTKSKLPGFGSNSEWIFSIKSLAYKITDQEMKTLFNGCLSNLSKRTGLSPGTIRKKLKDML